MEIATPATPPAEVIPPGLPKYPVPDHSRRPRALINVYTYDHAEANKIRQPGESWAQFFRLLLYFYIGAQGVAHQTPKRPPL